MIRKKGFTLIETLVVIVIIGVVLAVAMLTLNIFSGARKAKAAAVQLKSALQAAQQQAILLPAVLKLKIDKSGYQFLRYQHEMWKPLGNDHLSRKQAFQRQLDVRPPKKIIVISASGEVEPFLILLSDIKHSVTYRLQAKDNTILLNKAVGKK